MGGGPAIVWPGGDRYLAQAAQTTGIPYPLSTVDGMTIEAAAKIAPDVLWFQLCSLCRRRTPRGLVRRAHEAGVHVLMLTLDVPVRTTRPREVASGNHDAVPPHLAMALTIAASPARLMALWRNGHPVGSEPHSPARLCTGNQRNADVTGISLLYMTAHFCVLPH
jgi:L-lactate dehydrogenase (cytochrome)